MLPRNTFECISHGAAPALRLPMAFAASLALHLLAALLISPPLNTSGRAPQPHFLLAHLQTPQPQPPAPPPPAQEAPTTETASPALPEEATPEASDGIPVERKARFAAPPNFENLETLPSAAPGQLRLRLHVSAQGKLQRIEMLENTGTLPEFIAGVYEQIERETYAPAIVGGQAIDGYFDILIFASPATGPGDAKAPTVTKNGR